MMLHQLFSLSNTIPRSSREKCQSYTNNLLILNLEESKISIISIVLCVLIVEVSSNDKLEENIASPLARVGYAGSVFVCIPTALVKESIAADDGNGSISSTYGSSNKTADNNILPLGAMPGISNRKYNEGKWVFKVQMYIQ